MARLARPGIRTIELDAAAEEFILSQGAIPAFKGYRGFPRSACISINEQVVHGIPDSRKLREGDIVSIDVGTNLNGYFGDAAITLPVGEVDREGKRLLEVTEKALSIGIEMARMGNRLFDLHAIQAWWDPGFSVVRDFVGHGIGQSLHEEPQSLISDPRREPSGKGMIFALEPMVNRNLRGEDPS
jgi:methionyl aminopeptidase